MKVNVTELEARSRRLFEAAGVPVDDAKIMTDVLLQTEMRGVFTHGFFRVPYYLNCIRSGGIKTNGNITVVQDAPSMAVVDGNDNLGMVISKKAMMLAIEKAKATGDQNVYFIDGKTLFSGDFAESCTTDSIHPNDLGFYRMADVIGSTIAKILGIE